MTTKFKSIKWITTYDVETNNEGRYYSLSSKNKTDYIIDVMVRNGWNIEIISPSITMHEKGYYRKSQRSINKNIKLTLFNTFGAKSKLGRAMSKIFSATQLFCYLFFKVKRNELIIIGHTLMFAAPVYLAKKIKNFKLILDFGEEYNMVKKGNRIYQWAEPKLIQNTNKFIFGNDFMGDIYGISPINYIVVYGQYQNNIRAKKIILDNKIHLVYSGIISESEKSAFKAIELAKYLDKKYTIHILGKIDNLAEEHFYSLIEEVNSINDSCRVIYEGVKNGEEYVKQMIQYDIGLNLRSVDEYYIDFAFPSKVISYLNAGLRVVSSKIKCVEQSDIGILLDYYEDDNPNCISEVIRGIDLQSPFYCSDKLKELDSKLSISIESLIINNN